MDNYTVTITNVYNDHDCDYEIKFKSLIHNNEYIDLASFYISGYTISENKQSLINLKTHINDNIKMNIVLLNSNGTIMISKNNNYLTFEISRYDTEIYGECSFTVKINSEILKILNVLINGH
jgi:hypothetical protein